MEKGQRTEVRGQRLWKRLHVPLILTGSGKKGKEKGLLIELGMPEEDIIEERLSKDTSENARYAKQIIEKRGFKAPILVTSACHMKRAVFLFEKQGTEIRGRMSEVRGQEGKGRRQKTEDRRQKRE